MNFITNIVKEEGISKIILQYKKHMEDYEIKEDFIKMMNDMHIKGENRYIDFAGYIGEIGEDKFLNVMGQTSHPMNVNQIFYINYLKNRIINYENITKIESGVVFNDAKRLTLYSNDKYIRITIYNCS